MLRVNGLFGWVKANDRRSVLLFAGFVVALNVAAALGLYLPLAGLDPAHAPVFDWTGYLTRYVPLVTLAAAVVFGLQMLWHVKAVQRVTAFGFVDESDEPRLCRIVEPLAIAMGLPTPYVGVVESRALNAFACGVNRKNAVVVVTRGLIDGLDDDELASVVAHELAHIANGDIRLLAAANACLRMIGWLVRPRMRRSTRGRELTAFPLLMVVMPPLFLFVLITSLCAQSALKGSHLVRLLIASSREFIADATAVQVTQNPSALVSALERISGRSLLADIPLGQDAMMIDGPSDGAFATHPAVAQRIKAIVAITGSMAMIAPARRDTRSPDQKAVAGRQGRVSVLGVSLQPADGAVSALRRVGPDDHRNWLGLTPTMSTGALLAIAVFAGVHRQDLGDPGALAALLDPRPTSAIIAVAGHGMVCNVAVMGSVVGIARPGSCSGAAMQDFMATQAKVAGPVGALLSSMTQNGAFSEPPLIALRQAEAAKSRRGLKP